LLEVASGAERARYKELIPREVVGREPEGSPE